VVVIVVFITLFGNFLPRRLSWGLVLVEKSLYLTNKAALTVDLLQLAEEEGVRVFCAQPFSNPSKGALADSLLEEVRLNRGLILNVGVGLKNV